MAEGIDFELAEEVFAGSIDGTVGLEEEFALVDPETLELVPRFDLLRDAASQQYAEAEVALLDFLKSEEYSKFAALHKRLLGAAAEQTSLSAADFRAAARLAVAAPAGAAAAASTFGAVSWISVAPVTAAVAGAEEAEATAETRALAAASALAVLSLFFFFFPRMC